MPSAIFDDLTYFTVSILIPNGWTHQERRDSRKRVNRGIGQQNNPQPHMNTNHRRDIATLYDDKGALIQTANKALYRVDARSYADELDLINAVIAEITDELKKTTNAVTQKVQVTVLGNQTDTLAYLAANKADWGEGVG
ncbi:hypothetical protein LCGC14_1405320 [marine sediment metagenome]|uniref:Uncharacterized protein n=1 Tax=marine sediment metagenome TaxID=412755 RepID=A0A0F9MXF9_9ZZZZ